MAQSSHDNALPPEDIVRALRPSGHTTIALPEQGGRIIDQVAPLDGELVIAKTLPNAFTGAEFRSVIADFSDRPLVLAGFMTHMCISATARAALDAGLAATIAGDACATRPLPSATTDSVISAENIHEIALSELADRFAIVAPTANIM